MKRSARMPSCDKTGPRRPMLTKAARSNRGTARIYEPRKPVPGEFHSIHGRVVLPELPSDGDSSIESQSSESENEHDCIPSEITDDINNNDDTLDIINHNENVEESSNGTNVDKNVHHQDIVANSDNKKSDVSNSDEEVDKNVHHQDIVAKSDNKKSDVSKSDEEVDNGNSSESSSGSESNDDTQHSKKKSPGYNNVHRFPCTTSMTRNFSLSLLNNPPLPKSTPPFSAWIDDPLLKVPKIFLFSNKPRKNYNSPGRISSLRDRLLHNLSDDLKTLHINDDTGGYVESSARSSQTGDYNEDDQLPAQSKLSWVVPPLFKSGPWLRKCDSKHNATIGDWLNSANNLRPFSMQWLMESTILFHNQVLSAPKISPNSILTGSTFENANKFINIFYDDIELIQLIKDTGSMYVWHCKDLLANKVLLRLIMALCNDSPSKNDRSGFEPDKWKPTSKGSKLEVLCLVSMHTQGQGMLKKLSSFHIKAFTCYSDQGIAFPFTAIHASYCVGEYYGITIPQRLFQICHLLQYYKDKRMLLVIHLPILCLPGNYENDPLFKAYTSIGFKFVRVIDKYTVRMSTSEVEMEKFDLRPCFLKYYRIHLGLNPELLQDATLKEDSLRMTESFASCVRKFLSDWLYHPYSKDNLKLAVNEIGPLHDKSAKDIFDHIFIYAGHILQLGALTTAMVELMKN